jgi:hypothetical protein
MNVTGFPSSISPGQTICLTVTGATGSVTANGGGTLRVLSVTQVATRPSEWTVCVVVDAGLGTLDLGGGPGRAMSVAVVAR